MSRPLWTPDELTDALGPPTAPMRSPATGVSIDTRTLQKGDLFIAIKGDTHDGHDHVARAFAAGASAALVSRPVGDGPQFVTGDSLRGMERLGSRGAGALAPPASSPSPAPSARPAPRRWRGPRSPRWGRRTPRPPRSTITGACR